MKHFLVNEAIAIVSTFCIFAFLGVAVLEYNHAYLYSNLTCIIVIVAAVTWQNYVACSIEKSGILAGISCIGSGLIAPFASLVNGGFIVQAGYFFWAAMIVMLLIACAKDKPEILKYVILILGFGLTAFALALYISSICGAVKNLGVNLNDTFSFGVQYLFGTEKDDVNYPNAKEVVFLYIVCCMFAFENLLNYLLRFFREKLLTNADYNYDMRKYDSAKYLYQIFLFFFNDASGEITFRLARIYEFYCSGLQQKAWKYYKKACEKGNPESLLFVGSRYYASEEIGMAVNYYLELMNQDGEKFGLADALEEEYENHLSDAERVKKELDHIYDFIENCKNKDSEIINRMKNETTDKAKD